MPLNLVPSFSHRPIVPLGMLIVLVGFSSGCDRPSAAPANPSPVTQSRPEELSTSSVASTGEPGANPRRQLVRETWEVVLIQGAKVGYSHFEEYASKLDEQPVRELISNSELSIQRFGKTVAQSFELTSVESPSGQILRFGMKMLTGPSELAITGEHRDGKLLIETTTLGKTQTSSIDWEPTWGGFFADQQSLRQTPMQPGEERVLTALVPGFVQAGEIEFTAIHRESVKLLDEERELLKIESAVRIGGQEIKSILWADEAGDVLKVLSPTNLNQETYRTTRAIALRPGEKAGFDLGAQTVVKVGRPRRSPHASTQMVYRARLANGSPAKTFSNGASQKVKEIDAQTAEITVRAIRPDASGSGTENSGKPTEADRQPNNLIQSDDSAIISLAEHFAENQSDPWSLAKKFEVGVRDYVDHKDFSLAIGSASDVVRAREGDCTEHAVLLAALCRAKGIPARVAIGLVYFEPVQGFAYHMWNEVWIEKQWVPIDSTLGLGGIGAGHLKIADSDLSSASPVSALLPVIEVIGQLELEIVSFD